jgi:hypothetical protein
MALVVDLCVCMAQPSADIIPRLAGTMAELLCADLATRPVARHLVEWLDAARALLALGEHARAALVLDSALQAHEGCAAAHTLLVAAHLHMGPTHWPKALQIAR